MLTRLYSLWLYLLQARLVDGTEDSSSEGPVARGGGAAAAGRRERRGGSRGGDNQLSDGLRCPISLEVMANPCCLLHTTCTAPATCYLLLATYYLRLLLMSTTHYS